MYKTLSAIGPMFSIAAAFGNVHGVYKAGNVVLSPHLLAGHQKYIKEQIKSEEDKPAFLVMHGGSGSTEVRIVFIDFFRGSQGDVFHLGVTNSALVYEPKCGGSCGVSQGALFSCAHGAQINFTDLTPYLTYGFFLLVNTVGTR